MNLAIVIGVDSYTSNDFDHLPACNNDARVVEKVLNNIKDFKEILYINKNESGFQIKGLISDFIEKYKRSEVSELLFYFSGHGERFEDDFFYLPADFNRAKKETTGLRNSELDGWIKSIAPKLCVKIVDACFSGTQYIKSESNTESELKKSAQKYGLNDLYFWFSSRENEVSYAGSEFSRFTESILTALTEHKGEIRYRDIMAYVADDFSNAGSSKPVFITQADNIEKFGVVSDETHQIIFDEFGLEEEGTSVEGEKVKEPIHKKEESIYDLVKLASSEFCFSEKVLADFITDFNNNINVWSDDFKKLYDIKISQNLVSYEVPNTSRIGEWLLENKEVDYFAIPTRKTEEYEVEEYKSLPKKPLNKYDISNKLASLTHLGIGGKYNTEYKLETVTKTRSYVDGFRYSHSIKNRITSIIFEPTIEIIKSISLFIIPIYSNSKLVLHYSFEELNRSNWGEHSSPSCEKWKVVDIKINSVDSAKSSADYIKKEITTYVENKLKNIVGK
ncbi:caspase family protein [Psychromonas sp. L1A2]|uniref:caspase family protein n=1 Tax=Psychromonas sp. L1A2 TaxID=2686356 RepID=UPI00135CA2BB|nr:caspase family protein [Psychromonas sp. L1A2]